MSFKNYFAGTILLVLLIWGPIYNSTPNELLIRIGYLITIPFLVWLLLNWIWNKWEISKNSETLLNRILSATISITLVLLAISEASSKSHIENTEYIRTHDGVEAVGDYISLEGPNWRNVVVMTIIAGLIFWYGVLKFEMKKK